LADIGSFTKAKGRVKTGKGKQGQEVTEGTKLLGNRQKSCDAGGEPGRKKDISQDEKAATAAKNTKMA